MKISKDIINLFNGVYKEHGKEETVERLFRLLKINAGKIYVESIEFNEDNIKINCSTPITIYFEDEYYYSVREYPTYTTYNYYDTDTNIFRKTISFPTNDDNLIVLDSIESEQLSNIRILKTTKDDKDFTEGFFEKERMSVNKLPIEEESTYIEYTNDDTDEVRTLNIDRQDLYYYHAYSNAEDTRFMETAASINTPKYLVYGRLRKENDLLEDVEKHGLPNIMIRGNAKNVFGNLDDYYNIVIEKDPITGIIFIQIDLLHQPISKVYYDEFELPSFTNGPITTDDLTNLITFFNEEDYNFSEYIIEELRKISESLQIRQYKRTKSIDNLDLEMDLHPEFNELAYHIYENLDAFNDIIDDKIYRELSYKRKKLLN